MVEAEMCERCDGRGCRSCSGRGWLNRVLPAIPICRKVYPPVTLQDIDEMSNWPTSPPAAAVEAPAGTKNDAEVDHGEDEPDERIRITVQYPDARVKLIKVRWGTLSKALADAFNGRPWS